MNYPEELCVHTFFERQVERTPEALAVVSENQRLTYRQLNRRANQVAHWLLTQNIPLEAPIGLLVNRTPEMIIGFLGILKAGMALVPLDPQTPAARSGQIIVQTGIQVQLSTSSILGKVDFKDSAILLDDPDFFNRLPEHNPDLALSSSSLVYILYTSGTTGHPKGVMVEHRQLINYVQAVINQYGFQPGDQFAMLQPLTVDTCQTMLTPALTVGGTLHLISRQRSLNAGALAETVQQSGIDHLKIAPSHFSALLDAKPDADLFPRRTLILGGETLHWALIDRIRKTGARCTIWNHYGPTETTVAVLTFEVQKAAQADSIDLPVPLPNPTSATVPIGYPLKNNTAYILDAKLQPVTVGTAGDLYIGGSQVARGYVDNPQLTSKVFISDPFAPTPSRMYHTGDRARALPDGAIEFLGRSDDQVKIRGYRIEPGEIEAVLATYPGVQDGVVRVFQDTSGQPYLAAYCLPIHGQKIDRGQELTPHEIRLFLKHRLPNFMLPAVIKIVAELPHTPQGKVDRQALIAPNKDRSELRTSYAAPRTEVEASLALIWSELLGFENPGTNDNFFELGGHSLLVVQLITHLRETFQVELELKSVFDNPTIAELARLVENRNAGLKSNPLFRIQKIPAGTIPPLSYPQQNILFLQQLSPAGKAYHDQSLVFFKGPLDKKILEKCLDKIIQRHEIFRTTFHEENGQTFQRIHSSWQFTLPFVDLQPVPIHRRDVELHRLIDSELQITFDLSRLPLTHWVLYQTGPEDYVFLFLEHHLLHDGWSCNLFIRDLLEFYRADVSGDQPSLPELTLQFSDFAYWQHEWIESEEAHNQLAFWKDRLSDTPPLLQLPLDHPRPARQDFKGSNTIRELPVALYRALKRLSQQEETTLYMTMLAAFYVLLYKYTGQMDILIGSGVANRRWNDTENLIGMLINTIVLRTDLSGNPTFRELLQRVRKTTLDAYANQELPFDQIVQSLNPQRDLSRNTLFQVLFSFQDTPLPVLDLPNLEVDLQEGLSNGSAKMDLNIIVISRADQQVSSGSRKEEQIKLIWEYSTALFERETITRMIDHYLGILQSMLTAPDQKINQLPVITASERELVLATWNQTHTDYPADQCVQTLFETQAAETPNQTAVVFEGCSLTYFQLNQRANRLAHYLQRLGIGPGIPVGICVERSLEMVIGLLAILKAGGAYVPLDPTFPQERLAFMLQDTGAPVVITQAHLRDNLPGAGREILAIDSQSEQIASEKDHNPDCLTRPENLAYIIYTSGSTGQPKGVCIPHRGVVRLVKNNRYATLNSEEVFLQLAPLAFDASTFEIWGSLLNGARLEIFPAHTPGVDELANFICQQGITTLWLTAGLFHLMMEWRPKILHHLHQLLAGGDVLSVSHVRLALQQQASCRLINGYGPTENTTFTCCYPISAPSELETSVPIGRPIANTRVYILDNSLQPVPIGVIGELTIAGDGLALGYLNQPALTAEKFIPDPFNPDPTARLYRTGDLARFRPGGTIEFIGRTDHQIKLRGFRIELGEIESVLSQHPAVRQAVVLAREDHPGNKILVAYVIPCVQCSEQQLRRYLEPKLPGFMVPTEIVFMEQFPLTPTGKVDRSAFPAPQAGRLRIVSESLPPRSPVEKTIASIWTSVLGIENIGIFDNFFDLGGHSLLATQVIARIHHIFHIELPLRSLFEEPTLAGLAAQVQALSRGAGIFSSDNEEETEDFTV